MNAEIDLRALAEKYAGGIILECEWWEALESAARKLAWIISREGDADGERRQPYYIAMLIAEAVKQKRFSLWLEMRNEDKKRTARAETQGNSQIHPHYSTAQCQMQ